MSVLLSYLRNRRVVTLLAVLLSVALLLELRTTYSPQLLSSYLRSAFRDGGSKAIMPLGAGAHTFAATDTTAFWPQFYAALAAASPRCALPEPPAVASTPRFYPWGPPTERQDLIQLNEAAEEELREAHAWFVAQISAPSFPKPYFVPGSVGIVTSAGGKWLPESLVSLRILRRTGSTLPVDVFLATPEEAEEISARA